MLCIWSFMPVSCHIWAFVGFQAAIYVAGVVCPPRPAALVRFVRHICGCAVMHWRFLSCLRCPLSCCSVAARHGGSCCRVWRKSGAHRGCCSCSVLGGFQDRSFPWLLLSLRCGGHSQRHGCDGGCFVCSWKKVSVCDGKKTTLNCCMSTLWCVRGEIGKKC